MPKTSALATQEAQTPNFTSLLQLAISKESAIDVIERLAAMQKEARDYQAKVDFNDAMHQAQSKMKRIGMDAWNPQTKSKYTTYSRADGLLRPVYSEEGFSLSFDTADCPLPEHVRVTCIVARGGYERHYQCDIPADGKGPKGGDVMSKTHAAGSAMSYGMRYLLKLIFNVTFGDTDDDGNEAGLPQTEKEELIGTIKTADNPEAVKTAYLEALKPAMGTNDSTLIGLLTLQRKERLEELAKAKEVVNAE